MKRRDLVARFADACKGLYGEPEARSIAFFMAEEVYGISRRMYVSDPDAEVAAGEIERLCAELTQGRPAQYVAGRCEFSGLSLLVREGVLIPRPETEELVMRIRKEYSGYGELRMLDVCTGSGAIALALSAAFPGSRVTGVDISDEALSVAQENGRRYGDAVCWLKADVLAGPETWDPVLRCGNYDLVVSNPPYVPESDRCGMRPNVLDYEPALALFVADEDPLIFYRAIAGAFIGRLSDRGMLWFEIHERYAGQVCALLRQIGYDDVTCFDDMNGKPRMVRCRKS